MEELRPGLVGESGMIVRKGDLADSYGNPGVEVLATPRVVALMEDAAIRAVAEWLPEGAVSVGTWLEIFHQAPTPPGMEVTARADLVSIEGRKLVFRILVKDEIETVAEGKHERFIVDLERFMKKASGKGWGG